MKQIIKCLYLSGPHRLEAVSGNILVGVGAGTGITAKSSEAGGADMLIIYNSGRYRMSGRALLLD